MAPASTPADQATPVQPRRDSRSAPRVREPQPARPPHKSGTACRRRCTHRPACAFASWPPAPHLRRRTASIRSPPPPSGMLHQAARAVDQVRSRAAAGRCGSPLLARHAQGGPAPRRLGVGPQPAVAARRSSASACRCRPARRMGQRLEAEPTRYGQRLAGPLLQSPR